MCLQAADGTSLRDIGEILRYKCVNRGLDPGTRNGPQGWGWFPKVIETEVRARREQEAASNDPNLRKHWSQFDVTVDPDVLRGMSAFSPLDDFEATA